MHEIVERLTAQEYYPYEIDILEEKLVDYLELRKTVRADYPNLMPHCKPKHHFLRGETFIRGYRIRHFINFKRKLGKTENKTIFFYGYCSDPKLEI